MKKKIQTTFKREKVLFKNKESKKKMFNAKVGQIRRDNAKITDKIQKVESKTQLIQQDIAIQE